jgi:prolyl-tRNA synthetase
MTHGDDRGLRLPPAVAPDSVVIVPIHKDEDRTRILEAADSIAGRLRSAGLRVALDDRDARPGFKFADWELKGAPIRLDLGRRDLDNGMVTLVRRDDLTSEQTTVDTIETAVTRLLDSIQSQLYAQAEERRAAHTFEPATLAELDEFLRAATGFATAGWCGSAVCEAHVKDRTAATIRCLPLEDGNVEGACIVCGRPAAERATWAQAY